MSKALELRANLIKAVHEYAYNNGELLKIKSAILSDQHFQNIFHGEYQTTQELDASINYLHVYGTEKSADSKKRLYNIAHIVKALNYCKLDLAELHNCMQRQIANIQVSWRGKSELKKSLEKIMADPEYNPSQVFYLYAVKQSVVQSQAAEIKLTSYLELDSQIRHSATGALSALSLPLALFTAYSDEDPVTGSVFRKLREGWCSKANVNIAPGAILGRVDFKSLDVTDRCVMGEFAILANSATTIENFKVQHSSSDEYYFIFDSRSPSEVYQTGINYPDGELSMFTNINTALHFWEHYKEKLEQFSISDGWDFSSTDASTEADVEKTIPLKHF